MTEVNTAPKSFPLQPASWPAGFRHSLINGLSVFENLDIGVDPGKFRRSFRAAGLSIFVVKKGRGTININLNDFPVKENSLLILAPQALVRLSGEKQDLLISGVSFTLDFLSEVGMRERNADLFCYFSSQHAPVWSLQQGEVEHLSDQFSQLAGRVRGADVHPFGREILNNAFYIFLYEIAALGQRYSEVIRLSCSRQENLLIKFSNLVREQFREVRSVKSYASQLNVTPKYLSEVVKTYSGKNAAEIINDLVILEAKFLLRDSEMSIGEIADTLHFSDQSFFGKYFKRQTGVSPKAFRENDN